MEYNGLVDLAETRHCHGEVGTKFRLWFNNGVRIVGELGTAACGDVQIDLKGYGAWEKRGKFYSIVLYIA